MHQTVTLDQDDRKQEFKNGTKLDLKDLKNEIFAELFVYLTRLQSFYDR